MEVERKLIARKDEQIHENPQSG